LMLSLMLDIISHEAWSNATSRELPLVATTYQTNSSLAAPPPGRPSLRLCRPGDSTQEESINQSWETESYNVWKFMILSAWSYWRFVILEG